MIKGDVGPARRPGARASPSSGTVIFGIAFAFFKIQDMVSKSMGKGGIRSKEEDEIAGLDLPEMGVQAYPEFVQS